MTTLSSSAMRAATSPLLFPLGRNRDTVAPGPSDPTPERTETTAGRVPRWLASLARHWIWLGPLMIVVVGLFDLSCTLMAYHAGWLVEANPLARGVLARWGGAGLAVYRLTLMSAGCVLLVWGLRMYRLRLHIGAARRRIRTVVWGGQVVLVLSHAALVAWWGFWLLALT